MLAFDFVTLENPKKSGPLKQATPAALPLMQTAKSFRSHSSRLKNVERLTEHGKEEELKSKT